MAGKPVGDEERRRLIDAEVTLDGYPARILGRLNEYATVTTYRQEDPRLHYEWSWETAARVVSKGGAFRS